MIKDTRYKPACLPAGVPRIMGLNGNPADLGKWFRDHEQYGMALWLDAFMPRRGELKRDYKARLAEVARSLSADEQAMIRRVAIALPFDSWVTEEFVQRLQQSNASTVAAQRDRRKAYWAAKNQQY